MNILTIDLTKVFNKQKLLDAEIYSKRTHNKNMPISSKVLALLVELGEFANEGKEFKYWSIRKHEISRSKMLEEYIDCLHFFSTIANNCGVDPIISYEAHGLIIKIELLKDVFHDVAMLLDEKQQTVENITRALGKFLALGYASGFTDEEIFEMYNHKNEINFSRLREGY